jgi:hypothetical protein
MKIGDLVKVRECKEFDILHPMHKVCNCFFCTGKSNRIGFVTGVASRNSWHVMFDCGAWRLDEFDEANGEVKVISESH